MIVPCLRYKARPVALLTFDCVTLHLGKKRLFGELSMQIDHNDRIGLIGPNGSGKTSLLRVITGEQEVDGGNVSRKHNTRIGYLPQDIEVPGGRNILQMLRDEVPGRDYLESQIVQTEAELQLLDRAQCDERALLEISGRLAELHQRLDAFERDYEDHIALRILAGLGFKSEDASRDINEFSGGWKMRVLLASLLFVQPDLLLLDEPTNHLDMPSVAWLSAFLSRYQRPFILICHDREFLNEQVRRVVSFEPEGVRHYQGNYEDYLRLRAQEELVLENRARNIKREREKAEKFINRFRAQATKARAVQSRIKALDRMDEVEELGSHGKLAFRFPATSRTSKQVLMTEGLRKDFGDRTVLDGVSLSVLRGDKVGIIGANGAGKTTLLKMLAGEVECDGGSISFGHHVEVGYYAQHHNETLDPERTILEEVLSTTESLTPVLVRTLLGTLGFTGDEVEKNIKVLSGGERARVGLARLLTTSGNLLLMDEPTNHLDLASSERLSEALSTFDGALIFASHNRSFLRRLATVIWNVADGTVEVYPGTLDEYMTSTIRQLDIVGEESIKGEGPQETRKDGGGSGKERRRREAQERARRQVVLGPIKKRIEALESRITELEAVQSEREQQLASPEIFSDQERSAEINRAFQRDAGELERLTLEWEERETELENAVAQLGADAGDPLSP